MMPSKMIVNVNEINFEYEVITYSQNIPVVVDFWASWCRPCKVLGPQLERITVESNGTFRLAKVDVDANPNLAIQYNVRTIPTVKAFSGGEIVSEFVGMQPEDRIRDFIQKITPLNESGLEIEKAISMISDHDWLKGENLFRGLLDQNPQNSSSLLGLVKSILPQGKAFEAADIIRTFPASKEYTKAQTLLPFAEAMVDLQKDRLPLESDLDAVFSNCIRLASKGNLLSAADGLLDILRQDKHYQNDRARLIFLSILELMGSEDPETRKYQNELASVLF